MSKAKISRKQALMDGLINARRSLLVVANAVPEGQRDELFLGTWGIKHLIAHLIGWDHTNLQAVQEILAGQPPTFFQHYDKDWKSYNAQLVTTYQKEPFAALLKDVEESHTRLIQFLQARSDQDIVYGKTLSAGGRTITIRNLLSTEASDELTHAGQVQAFLDKQASPITV